MEFTDIGQTPSNDIAASKVAGKDKKYYPTVFIDNIEAIDGAVGDEVMLKGVIKRITEEETEDGERVSATIEIREVSCDCHDEEEGDGLEGAMDKIAKDKMEESGDE